MSAAATARVATPPAATLSVVDTEGARELRLAGRLDAYAIAGVWSDSRAALAAAPDRRVVVDASRVDYCDGGGIAMLVDLLRQPRPPEAPVTVRGLKHEFQTLLDQFHGRTRRAASHGGRNRPRGIDCRPRSADSDNLCGGNGRGALERDEISAKRPLEGCLVHLRAGRRQRAADRGADLFLAGHHPGVPVGSSHAPVRRGDFRSRPDRLVDPARAGPSYDGDPACRTLGRRVCGRDRHHEGQRGAKRAHDHGSRSGAFSGSDAHPRGAADGAAAHAFRGHHRHLGRRADHAHF
ncbi:MAG: STAS domain-containing protein [Betaproteobacteria bacterium]|nr:MAG: STAS domain-containing protein [Betaproteobacteria bacterium]